MSGNMTRDTKNQPMPGFAPTRIEAIAAGGTFAPGNDDRAFRVPETITYQIGGAGEIGTINGGAVTCIAQGVTFKIVEEVNIEIM